MKTRIAFILLSIVFAGILHDTDAYADQIRKKVVREVKETEIEYNVTEGSVANVEEDILDEKPEDETGTSEEPKETISFETFCNDNDGNFVNNICTITNGDATPRPDGIKEELSNLATASNNECKGDIGYSGRAWTIQCKDGTLKIEVPVNDISCSEEDKTFDEKTGECTKQESTPAEEQPEEAVVKSEDPQPAEEPVAKESGAEPQAEPDVSAEETHEAQPAEANESDTVLTDDDFSADVPAASIKQSEEVSAPEPAEEQSQQNPIQERALNYEMTISTSVSHTDGVTKATEQANTYAQTNSKAPDYECQQPLSDKPTYLCQSKTTQETIKIAFTGWTDETPATVNEPQVAKNEEDEKADEQAPDEEYQTKIIDSDKDTFIFKTAALDRASKAIDDSGAQFCQVKGNNVECTNETKKIKYVVQFAKIYETQEEYVNAEHPNKTKEDEKADTTADTKQLEADAKQIIDAYNKKKKVLEKTKSLKSA